uniref:Uncharacterized protein n=1 Tax=Arundo donax TaxID=35708 RepID=A0A0A9F9Z8_ARUDO
MPCRLYVPFIHIHIKLAPITHCTHACME